LQRAVPAAVTTITPRDSAGASAASVRSNVMIGARRIDHDVGHRRTGSRDDHAAALELRAGAVRSSSSGRTGWATSVTSGRCPDCSRGTRSAA
jgi:hypothetical protein